MIFLLRFTMASEGFQQIYISPFYGLLWVRSLRMKFTPSIFMCTDSALGAQADPLSPLNNTNADRYYRNAETALASSNILQSSTLLGIYAVFNLCFYLHMSHLKEDIERCIILQGVMIKMAQSMGLRM